MRIRPNFRLILFVYPDTCIQRKYPRRGKREHRDPGKETSERGLDVDLWRQTVKLQPWHFNWAQLYLEMNWLIATESFNSLLSLFISAKSLLAAEALIETRLPASPTSDRRWRLTVIVMEGRRSETFRCVFFFPFFLCLWTQRQLNAFTFQQSESWTWRWSERQGPSLTGSL